MDYIGKSNDNQITVINHIFNTIYSKKNVNNGFGGLTLKLMAGCHAKDTEILMYDGTIKKVQDITVKDILMGDDSTPRKILKLVRGKDNMYEINNKKGESYIVNGDHILCLKYITKNTIKYSKIYK
mgnify:FL=1